ncbi:hypothetical protein V2J09_022292 [Rumex salicifolius]
MTMERGLLEDEKNSKNGKHERNADVETPLLGIFDKPLPCCGCGIGWFSFLLGFFFPLMWYFATILYFANYYQRDPRERSGLAACAIAVSHDIHGGCGDHFGYYSVLVASIATSL